MGIRIYKSNANHNTGMISISGQTCLGALCWIMFAWLPVEAFGNHQGSGWLAGDVVHLVKRHGYIETKDVLSNPIHWVKACSRHV